VFTPTSKPRPHPDVVATSLAGGEVVLLHLGTKQYYSLNQTGARIWKLVEEQKDIAGISGRLEIEFDTTLPVAQENVIGLLDSLAAEKLVLAG
jgi:Coenzyme PQQ synthesis protein D (PqqD)